MPYLNTNNSSRFEGLLRYKHVLGSGMRAVHETHVTSERSDGATDKLVRQGWHAVANPAMGRGPGRQGRSGLLQLTPRAHGLGHVEWKRWRVLVPGLASAAHVAGVVPGDVAWFNIDL